MELFFWLFPDWITFFGVMTGAGSVLFLALNKAKLGWGLGIINAGFFVYLMFQYQLYADVTLNLYYLVTSAAGLYFWLRGRTKRTKTSPGVYTFEDGTVYGSYGEGIKEEKLPLNISHLNKDTTGLKRLPFTIYTPASSWTDWALIWLVGTLVMGFAIVALSSVPWWIAFIDTFTTVGSFIAQWLLARKVFENWYIWIFVDIIDIGLYLYKGLPAVAIMTVVYMVFCVMAIFKWRKIETEEQEAVSA